MTKSEFETLLCKAGELARDRDFFLIGSQALRGTCPAKPMIIFNRIEDLLISPDQRSELKSQTKELVAELRARSQESRRKK